MYLSKQCASIYLLAVCCLTSSFTIPFYNSTGTFPISYLAPLAIALNPAFLNFIDKKNMILLSLLLLSLLANGSSFITSSLIILYLVIFVIITSERFLRISEIRSFRGIFYISMFLIFTSLLTDDAFSSSRFIPRLKGFTLEASYLGMTLSAIFILLRGRIHKILTILVIITTQSGLALMLALITSYPARVIMTLLFFGVTLFLFFSPVTIDLVLSNSLLIRFSGILPIRGMDFLDLLFGGGIGYADQNLSFIFSYFGISENYSGSFIFGILADFGIFGSAFLILIILGRIPLCLALLILLNFALASPYFLFLSVAWKLADRSRAMLHKSGEKFTP
ncbi:MAG: hypothetical protein ACI9SC_000706 [Gammaproteobacteria bacterium]|jgi:hypothetical protein